MVFVVHYGLVLVGRVQDIQNLELFFVHNRIGTHMSLMSHVLEHISVMARDAGGLVSTASHSWNLLSSSTTAFWQAVTVTVQITILVDMRMTTLFITTPWICTLCNS